MHAENRVFASNSAFGDFYAILSVKMETIVLQSAHGGDSAWGARLQS